MECTMIVMKKNWIASNLKAWCPTKEFFLLMTKRAQSTGKKIKKFL